MAIDRIPGVGPQNTDIATAVAAAVPTIAAITSSITTNAASAGLTNASITSAGNAAGWGATGPTTTQIAAAVPTLAQITSAVTTNAASAGVTIASITSAGNSAGWGATGPFGGTWTTIYDNKNITGVTTVTVSGLGSYKYLKIIYNLNTAPTEGVGLFMRVNGDTAGNYFYNIAWKLSGTAEISTATEYQAGQIQLNTLGAFSNFCTGVIDWVNPQSGSFKYCVTSGPGRVRPGSGQIGTLISSNGGWFNNTAISSVTIFNNAANFASGSLISILGAN
jgi:hypothetical protein